MTLAQLIAQARAAIAAKLAARSAATTQLAQLREAATIDEEAVQALRDSRDNIDAELDALEARLNELLAEEERDAAVGRLQERHAPTAAATETRGPGYDQVHRVGQEARTYSPESDRRGAQFLADVAAAFVAPTSESAVRLSRHMQEERAERGDQLTRAVGTGAFTGLVIPQYLTDLFALPARAGRPFADACNHHELPAQGMVVYIGRGTTATSVTDQAAEGDLVSETDFDDTLLSIPVRTAGGSQTISRQAAERGIGIDDILMADLFKAYATNLDSNLINRATSGLRNVATTVTYTDASPTAPELHPKLLQAASTVEGNLLDVAQPDIAVMHSRRWYWLQSQVSSLWPYIGNPNIRPQLGGESEGNKYGAGFRGFLPSGLAVVVDNNVGTTLGAGTEDEIYVAASDECHLWEDPKAPMFIRAEAGANVKRLQIDLVAYGYYAFTAERYTGAAAKVAGTGLIAPTF